MKQERVTYNGEIFTIDEKRLRSNELMYKLSGKDYYVRASECTHWLSGWFYKFFNYFDK